MFWLDQQTHNKSDTDSVIFRQAQAAKGDFTRVNMEFTKFINTFSFQHVGLHFSIKNKQKQNKKLQVQGLQRCQ